MKKRLIGLTLLFILLFSFTACSQGLATYKEEEDKQAMENAINKDDVNEVVENAKQEIYAVQKEGEMVLEEKIIWDGTIADIVDNETILIAINKNFNSKEFTVEEFKVVDIVEDSFSWITKTAYDNYIKTQSLPEDFTHIIIIKIVDKGKQNLINAIRTLEAIDFIYCASPNSFDSPN